PVLPHPLPDEAGAHEAPGRRTATGSGEGAPVASERLVTGARPRGGGARLARRLAGDARAGSPDPVARGERSLDGAAGRGERYGEGMGSASGAPPEPAGERPLRGGELRRAV